MHKKKAEIESLFFVLFIPLFIQLFLTLFLSNLRNKKRQKPNGMEKTSSFLFTESDILLTPSYVILFRNMEF